jgi:hypothetical protein
MKKYMELANYYFRKCPYYEIATCDEDKSRPYFIICNKTLDTYIKISSDFLLIFAGMDGQTSMSDIIDNVFIGREPPDPTMIIKYISLLYKKQMIIPNNNSDQNYHFIDSSQNPNNRRWLPIMDDLIDKIKSGFSAKCADRIVTIIYKYFGKFLFTGSGLISIAIISILGIILFISFLSEHLYLTEQWLSSNLSIWILMVLSAGIFISIAGHELGHALTCKHNGRKIIAIGIKFTFGLPTLFTDTSDMWMLSKKKRIIIDASGMIGSILLGSLSTIMTLVVASNSAIRGLLFLSGGLNYLSVLFSLIPFSRSDGYYILEDLFDIPNFKEISLASLLNYHAWDRIIRHDFDSPISFWIFAYGISFIIFWSCIMLVAVFIFHFLCGTYLSERYGVYYTIGEAIMLLLLFIATGIRLVANAKINYNQEI